MLRQTANMYGRAFRNAAKEQERLAHAQQRQQQRYLQGANRAARTIAAAGGGIRGFGQRVSGGFGGQAYGMAKGAAFGAAAGGAYGLANMVRTATDTNKLFESGEASIASTLQLFGDGSGQAAKFKDNLGAAKHEFEELFKVATRSPATLEETITMYRNMLPGAYSSSHNLGKVMGMQEQALALGMLMGGDYATTGAQLSRMFSGGAGAEQETWRAFMAPVIKEIGIQKGYMPKNQREGADLTAAFNALDKGKRFELIEAGLKRLEPVVLHLQNTYEGLTSRAAGSLELLRVEMGKPIFDAKKGILQMMMAPGGVLDPGGKTMKELKAASVYIGKGLALLVSKLGYYLVDGIARVANNWEVIADKLMKAFDTAYYAASLYLKYQVARTITGGAVQGVGGAVGLFGRGASGVTNMASAAGQMGISIGAIGRAAVIAGPIVAALAMAIGGGFLAFAGVAAFFTSKWQEIVNGFYTGQIVLAPLLDIFDDFWAKLVAVGTSLMGTDDAVGGTNAVIMFMTDALNVFMGIGYACLRVLGFLDIALEAVVLAFEGLYTGIVAMITGLLNIISAIPGVDKLDGLKNLVDVLGQHTVSMGGRMREDIGDITNNRFLQAADAYDKAYAAVDSGVTAAIRDMAKRGPKVPDASLMNQLLKAENDRQKAERDLNKGRRAGKNVVNIGKVVVNQDLRNHDPDRVIGAFWHALDQATTKRTQAMTQIPLGR